MGELSDSIKKPVKIVLGCMASIGAGAVIGAALKYVPKDQIGLVGRICAGIGISGLAIAAGESSRAAIETSVDKAFAGAEIFEAVADGIKEGKERAAKAKSAEEPDEFEEDEDDVEPA